MKKIVHVITNFSELGGAESMLIRVLNSSPQDQNIKVISLMQITPDMQSRLPEHIQSTALGASGPVSMLMTSLKLIRELSYVDTVFSWMYHANFVTALSKVISFKRFHLCWGVRHSLDDYASESVSTKVAIRAGKLLGKVPDKVVYCAQRALKQHVQFGYSPQKTAVYIPNGYYFSDFETKYFSGEKLVIGGAGRLHEAKDFKTFFRIAAQLQSTHSNIEFVIVGRGMDSQSEILNRWIDELNIDKNRFNLRGPTDDMASFYKECDFFLLSSITEGFPNVLAEAASHGCICFSTDVGDARLIVNDTNRVFLPKEVNKGVSIIANYLLLSADELTEVSLKSAEEVRSRYSIQKVTKEFMSVGNV
ncbi:glycosyltransferase [Pseudoalteromonas sp. MMG013]|uniref:glycosyltransferase n=1 Tax=Pseudoalteromonas sp. MMG013 TaxID=2822687 RepID=UPI001B358681|nr:glycosyltransferase [Pseudoalteromonas sp. MMG013]MBQ4860875.1 glycosyltransferase [Pseudoalteromonas sp. MMG013]